MSRKQVTGAEVKRLLIEERQTTERDAARWRALVACQVLVTAGDDGFIEAQFWREDADPDDCDKADFIAFVDRLVEAAGVKDEHS